MTSDEMQSSCLVGQDQSMPLIEHDIGLVLRICDPVARTAAARGPGRRPRAAGAYHS